MFGDTRTVQARPYQNHKYLDIGYFNFVESAVVSALLLLWAIPTFNRSVALLFVAVRLAFCTCIQTPHVVHTSSIRFVAAKARPGTMYAVVTIGMCDGAHHHCFSIMDCIYTIHDAHGFEQHESRDFQSAHSIHKSRGNMVTCLRMETSAGMAHRYKLCKIKNGKHNESAGNN